MDTLNEEQQGSSIGKINGPKMARKSNKEPNTASRAKSKTDARFWTEPGRLKFHDSPDYSARIQVDGKRIWFPLGSPNKKTAAAKAAEIYTYFKGRGLAATLALYKPDAPPSSNSGTIGEFIATACGLSTARRQSLDAYTKAFRLIVSEIKGIKSDRKHDFRSGGQVEWRKQIDAVQLANITPAEIVAWKNRRLGETDPLAKRRAIVTVNSLIRNAKALFGKKILPFIELSVTVPRPLPFEGVSLEKAPSMRYVSKIDPYAILASAREDMAESDPEGFKVMLLALVCGLRRSEIDHLLWRAFDFSNSKLRVEASEFHALKSEDSAGEIDLDADTLALFRGYRAKNPKSIFVIESTGTTPDPLKARSYRCDAIFKTVLAWLRTQGVEATKPLHTMRKEIGSIIASEHGIFEASRYLRHSDIRITSAIYADKKKIVTPKTFAGLLAAAPAAETVDFHKAGTPEPDAEKSRREGNA